MQEVSNRKFHLPKPTKGKETMKDLTKSKPSFSFTFEELISMLNRLVI